LKSQGFLSLYFHPWEFVDIEGFGLPKYTTIGCQSTLFERLNQLVEDLKPHGEFITYQDFARSHSSEHDILKA
jgi:hypothetical protein